MIQYKVTCILCPAYERIFWEEIDAIHAAVVHDQNKHGKEQTATVSSKVK